MHDIWNPWHGCIKKSEGCDHCYMYYLDRVRGANGATIYRTANMRYPLARDRQGNYKIRSGELIRVCMTSDFFLAEADEWRHEAWNVIRNRPDVSFFLLTKRPERIADHLPEDWGDGWENVMLNVTCENQRRADERLPILADIPAVHKGIMCAPLIGPIHLGDYLHTAQLEQVICGGENYDGARPCDFDWIRALHEECVTADVRFAFIETGTHFIKDGRHYRLPSKRLQSETAFKSGMNWPGRPIQWKLCNPLGFPIAKEDLHVPHYRPHCHTCASKLICNGCADCGQCER